MRLAQVTGIAGWQRISGGDRLKDLGPVSEYELDVLAHVLLEQLTYGLVADMAEARVPLLQEVLSLLGHECLL
jgi:hypothetical protein